MPRFKKKRMVSAFPSATSFVPMGLPATGRVNLSVEELEAIRLIDFEGLDQQAAADLMGVSRQTFGRVLARARGIVSQALVTSQVLTIGGGDYEVRGGHGRRKRRGWGRGRMGMGDGPPENGPDENPGGRTNQDG